MLDSLAKRKMRALQASKIFLQQYPTAWCTLNYKTTFELLISVILSAQCTDARINMITPSLFAKYSDAKALSEASQKDVEHIIHSAGFYRTKAKNLIKTSKLIMQNFGGEVPDTMEGLLTLAGVARKTANIVLFHEYGKNEGIAVDTHCMRISYRLGLTSKRHNQQLSEKELMKVLPKKYWGMYTNWMVMHGRKYCIARNPKCDNCPLRKLCPKKGI